MSMHLMFTSVAIQGNSVPWNTLEVHEKLLEAMLNVTYFKDSLLAQFQYPI